MAVVENKPGMPSVLARIASLPASLLAPFEHRLGETVTYPLLEEQLAQSIAWIEDVCTTRFDCGYLPIEPEGISIASQGGGVVTLEGPEALEGFFTLADSTEVGYEVYDGNATNQIVLRKRPALYVAQLQLVTPILGYVRVYTPAELKLYVREGVLKVWTYKLATEQALLQTVDYQAWGSLLPPLPQAVQVAYSYGFPLFDPECEKLVNAKGEAEPKGPGTSLDGAHTWKKGDRRDPELLLWLSQLQEAAVCNTAAQFLAQSAGLIRGVATSMSFDGYSRGLAGSPFQSEVQALIGRRDQLLDRRRRRYAMATLG